MTASVFFLPSLLGSVQRPHSDGEKWNKAEQPPTDPDPDAASSALRSECLSSLTSPSFSPLGSCGEAQGTARPLARSWHRLCRLP